MAAEAPGRRPICARSGSSGLRMLAEATRNTVIASREKAARRYERQAA